jgi:phosphohistidine phosphatase
MDLYLMQHGEATTETEDPARPLTEAGREAVQRVADRAKAAGAHLDISVHSGKLRAEQTALILAGAVDTLAGIQARDGLAPNDPPGPTAEWPRELGAAGTVAVVGHMPFLARLASLLLMGDETVEIVQFRLGGLVKLVPTIRSAGFAVAWALPPELA